MSASVDATPSAPTLASARQRALVVGAGVGGLMAALALQRGGFEVRVLEKDTAPPADWRDAGAWQRPGVPQALHPHFYMGRLRLLIEERYPDLLAALHAAGATRSEMVDFVHPIAAAAHRVLGSDARLESVNARRTTFEAVVREYARAQGGIKIVSAAQVEAAMFAPGTPPRVTGVRYVQAGEKHEAQADVVVDASGRFGKLGERLMADAGVTFDTTQRDSGIWYFTRHYRVREGRTLPSFAGLPGAQFADFIVGALPADNGYFTVTFQISREDREIAKAIRQPAHFQAMCMRVAKIRPWVDPDVAEPVSDVYGFGQMDSYWRRIVVNGAPQVLGYFPVGDACLRSNPKFGRGCTWTSVAAHELAAVLAATQAPEQRALRYDARLRELFQEDWETMQQIDRSAEAAFAISTGRREGTLAERAAMRFDTLVNEASVLDSAVFREVWTGYHGLTGMKAWTRKPVMWLRLLLAALRRPLHARMFDALAGRPTREELATPTA